MKRLKDSYGCEREREAAIVAAAAAVAAAHGGQGLPGSSLGSRRPPVLPEEPPTAPHGMPLGIPKKPPGAPEARRNPAQSAQAAPQTSEGPKNNTGIVSN